MFHNQVIVVRAQTREKISAAKPVRDHPHLSFQWDRGQNQIHPLRDSQVLIISVGVGFLASIPCSRRTGSLRIGATTISLAVLLAFSSFVVIREPARAFLARAQRRRRRRGPLVRG